MLQMKKRKAEKVLQFMIAKLIVYLDELSDCYNVPDGQFEYGEKTAYVECLEWIQLWEYADVCGVNFEVEERYPL